MDALRSVQAERFDVLAYEEHALGAGASAQAVAYVELSADGQAEPVLGVGMHADIVSATLAAIVCGLNRYAERHAGAVLDTVTQRHDVAGR